MCMLHVICTCEETYNQVHASTVSLPVVRIVMGMGPAWANVLMWHMRVHRAQIGCLLEMPHNLKPWKTYYKSFHLISRRVPSSFVFHLTIQISLLICRRCYGLISIWMWNINEDAWSGTAPDWAARLQIDSGVRGRLGPAARGYGFTLDILPPSRKKRDLEQDISDRLLNPTELISLATKQEY